MEPRRLKYLHVLKSREPRALHPSLGLALLRLLARDVDVVVASAVARSRTADFYEAARSLRSRIAKWSLWFTYAAARAEIIRE